MPRTLNDKEIELRNSIERCAWLTKRNTFLIQDPHRFKARCGWAEEIRFRAVEKPVDRDQKCFESSSNKRIKRVNSRIEDLVRDPAVALVAADKIATVRVPQVIKRV